MSICLLNGQGLTTITIDSKEPIIDEKVEWYFHIGQLIYSEQTWTDKTTNKVVDNEKFYFNNEYLIAWYKGDKKVDANSQDFKSTSDAVYTYAAKLKTDNLK